MERFLITQSLLSAWAYQWDCNEGYEEEAREDFLRALRREPVEPSAAMLNGRAFEDMVYRAAEGKAIPTNARWRTGALAIADIIRGAQIQVRASREIEVGGMSFLVYGILDALKAGVIYDVKYMEKSLNSADVYGKYLDSAQHPAYFYIVPEAAEFRYLLSDGEDVYTETYRVEDTRPISEVIQQFIGSIRGQPELMDIYQEKWLAR